MIEELSDRKRVEADRASRPRCVSNEMNQPGGITRAIFCPIEITFYLRLTTRFHRVLFAFRRNEP